MSVLMDVVNAYFPDGVRFMIILLEDDQAKPPNYSYCQYYADKYGLDTDLITVVIDPLKKSLIYYDSSVVSLSVITDRTGKIVFKAEINAPGPFKWQIDWELKKLCDELVASGTTVPYGDDVVEMCEGYEKELPLWEDPTVE